MSFKYHISAYQHITELYILTFLNKGNIKRKILENYFFNASDIAEKTFNDIYIPIVNELQLPINEHTLNDKDDANANANGITLQWEIDIDNLLSDFLQNYFNYLQEKSLTIMISREQLKTDISTLITCYQEYWSRELQSILENKLTFPWQILVLMAQASISGSTNSKVITFLPIYFCLSTRMTQLPINHSEELKSLEDHWKLTISKVPGHIDMINYYNSLLIKSISKTLSFEDKTIFNEITNDVENRNIRNYIESIYPVFKQQVDKGDNIAYIFSAPPLRDDGYWYLLLGVKEGFLSTLPQNKDHRIVQDLIELQKSNPSEYDLRNNLLLQIVLRSLIALSDTELKVPDGENYFFTEMTPDGKVNVLFGFEINK